LRYSANSGISRKHRVRDVGKESGGEGLELLAARFGQEGVDLGTDAGHVGQHLHVVARIELDQACGLLAYLGGMLDRGRLRRGQVGLHNGRAHQLEDGEEQDTESQVDAQRLDIALAPAVNVFRAQETRFAQQEIDRLPQAPFERHIMADELMDELAGAGHVQPGFLPTHRAVMVADGGAAVVAVVRFLVQGQARCH
jgi:hypothetical protein